MLAISSQVTRSIAGKEYLRKITIEAPGPGVRQSALRAYDFAGDMEALDLLCKCSSNEANAYVREVAKKVLKLNDKGCWAL